MSALVDLFEDATYQVDIPAGRPESLTITSYGKMNMIEPRTLTALLIHAHQFAMASHVVLTIEGHGAGYLPDLDLSRLARAGATGGTSGAGQSPILPVPNPTSGLPTNLADQSPVLPVPNPTSGLPTSNNAVARSPVLPVPNPTSGLPASAFAQSPVLPVPNPTSWPADQRPTPPHIRRYCPCRTRHRDCR